MYKGLLQGHKIKISQIIKNAGKTTVHSNVDQAFEFLMNFFLATHISNERMSQELGNH